MTLCLFCVFLHVLGVCITSVHLNPVTQRKTYVLDKLVRVHPRTVLQVAALERLQESASVHVDFWKRPQRNSDIDIHVPRSVYGDVRGRLTRAGMKPTILINNLQNVIDMEEATMRKPDYPINAKLSSWACQNLGINCNEKAESTDIVGTYARHNDINNWLQYISIQNSALASVQSIGTSYEGRGMKIIKIGRNYQQNTKPIIWIEAGIHAREWIAPAVAIYTINKLVNDYGKDSDVTYMMNEFDWYILPSANPDGYEYSHTTDRLWRKTRSPQSRGCVGADPNRNFDISFGGAGTSTNPCSGIYPGNRAFSETETTNIRDAILAVRDRIKVFLSFHAYSQLLLTPYGYTYSKPNDNAEMMRVAQLSMASLKSSHGRTYQVGSPPDILYPASGGSYDWAKAVVGIKYSYTYEMRPAEASFGQSGFILSEAEVIPNSEEVWESLVTIAKEVNV